MCCRCRASRSSSSPPVKAVQSAECPVAQVLPEHGVLLFGGGARTAPHQPGDRAANQEGQARPAQGAEAADARHRRVGQVHFHQADAHHPRQRLLRGGQARTHQARFPEYLHGHELDDQGHGGPQDTLQDRKE